jgi:hypothetical protein
MEMKAFPHLPALTLDIQNIQDTYNKCGLTGTTLRLRIVASQACASTLMFFNSIA